MVMREFVDNRKEKIFNKEFLEKQSAVIILDDNFYLKHIYLSNLKNIIYHISIWVQMIHI